MIIKVKTLVFCETFMSSRNVSLLSKGNDKSAYLGM